MSEGLISEKEIFYTNMEEMCYNYGWTPKEFREQSPKDIAIFSAILAGNKHKRGFKLE